MLAWEVADFKDLRVYLGLQAEGAPMVFRNIRIKEFGYVGLNDLRKWAGAGGSWKTDGGLLTTDGKAALKASPVKD